MAVISSARLPVERTVGARVHASLARVPTGILWALVVLWTLPTLGLLVNSFREPRAQRTTGWWNAFTDPTFTIDSYRRALTESTGGSLSMWDYFLNSVSIVVPATVIPIGIAALAAYAFAWMNFPGRHWLFIITIACLALPLQASLVPLLTLFGDMGILGEHLSLWLAHTAFGLPLATYLLRNYIGSLPSSLIESAKIDGADHFTIFWRLIIPLSVPALAAFAIFQFLWVWNDLLVAYVFLGGTQDNQVLTIALANLVGARGENWHLLTAAAFISMLLPLLVFFSLQRYFIRGLTAGSVKG